MRNVYMRCFCGHQCLNRRFVIGVPLIGHLLQSVNVTELVKRNEQRGHGIFQADARAVPPDQTLIVGSSHLARQRIGDCIVVYHCSGLRFAADVMLAEGRKGETRRAGVGQNTPQDINNRCESKLWRTSK